MLAPQQKNPAWQESCIFQRQWGMCLSTHSWDTLLAVDVVSLDDYLGGSSIQEVFRPSFTFSRGQCLPPSFRGELLTCR